jgi:hypothetical protein
VGPATSPTSRREAPAPCRALAPTAPPHPGERSLPLGSRTPAPSGERPRALARRQPPARALSPAHTVAMPSPALANRRCRRGYKARPARSRSRPFFPPRRHPARTWSLLRRAGPSPLALRPAASPPRPGLRRHTAPLRPRQRRVAASPTVEPPELEQRARGSRAGSPVRRRGPLRSRPGPRRLGGDEEVVAGCAAVVGRDGRRRVRVWRERAHGPLDAAIF